MVNGSPPEEEILFTGRRSRAQNLARYPQSVDALHEEDIKEQPIGGAIVLHREHEATGLDSARCINTSSDVLESINVRKSPFNLEASGRAKLRRSRHCDAAIQDYIANIAGDDASPAECFGDESETPSIEPSLDTTSSEKANRDGNPHVSEKECNFTSSDIEVFDTLSPSADESGELSEIIHERREANRDRTPVIRSAKPDGAQWESEKVLRRTARRNALLYEVSAKKAKQVVKFEHKTEDSVLWRHRRQRKGAARSGPNPQNLDTFLVDAAMEVEETESIDDSASSSGSDSELSSDDQAYRRHKRYADRRKDRKRVANALVQQSSDRSYERLSDDDIYEPLDLDLDSVFPAGLGRKRSKKKQRKSEREELRRQGLLGRKSKKNSAWHGTASKEGSSVNQVRNELENFLSAEAESLALPAMDPASRKVVHEIGHRLGLKTKSHGKGNSRYPVMIKTKRTKNFDKRFFESVSQRYLPRASSRHGIKAARLTEKYGARGPGVSYQDGEIVGAAAPELDSGNKGRALLEKMGWSAGNGLGAQSNRGIAVPVLQVVKTTKAGLG